MALFVVVLFRFRFFGRGQAHFGHAALGRAGDHAVVAAQCKAVAHLGQVAGLFLHQAVDRVGVDVLVLRQAQHLVQVIHTGAAQHDPAAVRLLVEVLGLLVVIIPDLAHQLFQNILQRDDALGTAVLIHHHGQMMVLLPQSAQQLGDLGRTGGVQGGLDQLFQRSLLFQACQIEVLFVHHTDDVVNGVVVNRQAGIARFGKGLGHLVQRGVVLHSHHVHAGGQDLLHLHVIEFDGTADQLALPVCQFAVVFCLADHSHQLALCDGVLLAAVDKMAQQLFPLGEQPVQRGEQHYQQAQHRGHGRGHGLRHLLGQALGGHLAKDQHHHCQHQGGHGGTTLLAQPMGKKDGADRGGADVHDVVADEDGGKQLVVFFRQGQHPGGRAVTVLGTAFQADLIQGRKSGLGGGEKGGKGHQEHQRYNERHTAIVHKEENHTQLSVIFRFVCHHR